MPSAVVVGGGIVGLSVAHSLLGSGFKVSVVNQSSASVAASWGNAGHIAVEQMAPLASMRTVLQAPMRLMSPHGGLGLPLRDAAVWMPFSFRLLRASLPHRYADGKAALAALQRHATPAWQRFVQALSAEDLLRFDGHYVAWSSEKGAAAGRKQWFGDDIGTASVREATAEELARLRALAPGSIAAAIRFSGTGQVNDPDVLRNCAVERIIAAGGQVLDGTATALRLDGSLAKVELSDGRLLTGDIVVVAAGVHSRELLRQLGYRIPMIAERGYHIQYRAERWPADTPPIVFEDKAMIVTRFASMVRAAGFVEFCRPDSPADAKKWRRLERNVEELNLGLGRPAGEWIGSRPTLPDYLPAIGRSRRAANLLYAFGHQHLGLTLGPITGEIIAALAKNDAPVLDTKPFDLERF